MASPLSTDDLEDRLRMEFVDDARDRLELMNATLADRVKGERSDTDTIGVLRLEAHNFKGMGTSFGYPTVSLVAHRLEDYLSGLKRLDEKQLVDAQIFIDRISELVDRAEQPLLAETNKIIRALPVRYEFQVTDVADAVFSTIAETLARGEPVRITGFATFTVKDRAERLGKNPKTGETIKIKSSRKVSLRPGKDLTATVNAGL